MIKQTLAVLLSVSAVHAGAIPWMHSECQLNGGDSMARYLNFVDDYWGIEINPVVTTIDGTDLHYAFESPVFSPNPSTQLNSTHGTIHNFDGQIILICNGEQAAVPTGAGVPEEEISEVPEFGTVAFILLAGVCTSLLWRKRG